MTTNKKSEEINEKLREIHEKWEITKLKPYMDQHKDMNISKPFEFGVSDDFCRDENHSASDLIKVMVVGQETNKFHLHDDPDEKYRCDQQWSIDYFNAQLNKAKFDDIDINTSSYWNLFRTLKKNKMISCWNNIDNVQQYESRDSYIGINSIQLNKEAESELNSKIGDKPNDKTLLQYQIEIVEPDIVLFVIGPKYKHSLATALNIDENALSDEYTPYYSTKLSGKENKDYVKNITKLTNYKIPVYWSYHPAYLNRRGKIEELVEQIKNKK